MTSERWQNIGFAPQINKGLCFATDRNIRVGSTIYAGALTYLACVHCYFLKAQNKRFNS